MMKYFILLFALINGIVGEFTNEPNYGNCEEWSPLIKSTGFDMATNCCIMEGFECENSKVISIDIIVNSGVIDMTKLPPSINLEKFSIKGDIYKGVFPIQLLNSKMYKILDLSDSNIKEIPENIDYNESIEEVYLKNNKIEKFPYQFQKMLNLRILDLENNDITGSLSEFCQYFNVQESLNVYPTISFNYDTDIIYDLYSSCYSTDDDYTTGVYYDDFYDSYHSGGDIGFEALSIFFSVFVFTSVLMVSTSKSSSTTHEDYLNFRNEYSSSRQELDVLPNYNDVADISDSPPNYTETDESASSQNYQQEDHLPTYEETIDIAVISPQQNN